MMRKTLPLLHKTKQYSAGNRAVCLGMTGTINALVHDNLADGGSADSSWSSCRTSALRQQNCWVYTTGPGMCSPESTSVPIKG